MSVYEQRILPHLVNWSMRQPAFTEYRRRVLVNTEGCVLEIGIGSGLNLPHYGDAVTHVIGLDPSPKLLTMAQGAGQTSGPSVELVRGPADAIPLENESIDAVVSPWTLCSVPAINARGDIVGFIRRAGDGKFASFLRPRNRQAWRNARCGSCGSTWWTRRGSRGLRLS